MCSLDKEEHHLRWSCEVEGIQENGILKVTKESMVVMKDVRNKMFYYLKGSTVTCVLAATVDSDDDAIKLWHIRLGHAGEKSMQALAKQGLLKSTQTCKIEFCEHVY